MTVTSLRQQTSRVGLRCRWHHLQHAWSSRRVLRPSFPPGMTGLVFGAGVLGVALLGCGSDTTGLAPRDPTRLPWRLVLNHHAVTLLDSAPYDTVQLIPTLTTASGAAVPGPVTLSYTTSDLTSAVVDAHGLVTARGANNNVVITATATAGGVTVQDTVQLVVNAAASLPSLPPTLPTALKIQAVQNPFAPFNEPVPPTGEGPTIDCESGRQPDMRSLWLVPELLVGTTPLYTSSVNFLGPQPVNFLTSSTVSYASSDPTLLKTSPRNGPLTIANSICQTTDHGTVVLRATATVYGVTVSDSVVVTVIPALSATVAIVQQPSRTTGQPINAFSPDSFTISAGGIVKWRIDNTLSPPDSIDVVFDHPPGPVQGVDTTAVSQNAFLIEPYPFEAAGGNIAPFVPTDTVPYRTPPPLEGVRARQFPVPGTYHYHSALYGTTGVIVVSPR